MKIRRIEKKDIKEFGKLIVEHAKYEKLYFGEFNKHKQLELLLFSTQPKIFGWVVVEENKLIGYMTATIDYSTWNADPFVYMDCLYLSTLSRNKSIGQLLIKKLKEFGKENNCTNIQWQTPPDNIIGINFYRKIGAKELEKYRFSININRNNSMDTKINK